MKINIKELVDKHTTDGIFDAEKAQEEFQHQWNGFEAKEKPKRLAAIETAKTAANGEFITGLGIEGVSDKKGFLQYAETLKTSSSDKDTELSKIREQYKDYDSIKAELGKNKSEMFNSAVKSKLAEKFSNDYVEDQFALIQGKFNEDKSNIDELIKAQSEDKKYLAQLKAPPSKIHVKRNQSDKNEDKKPVNRYARFY